jgi:hypothetical protein
MDMDFAVDCPLVRPDLPHIRFLFVGSRVRSTLPSDSPSRFCPCASLVLHLHQVAQGTCTPKLLDMPSTQPGACGAPRVARLRGLTPVRRRDRGIGAVDGAVFHRAWRHVAVRPDTLHQVRVSTFTLDERRPITEAVEQAGTVAAGDLAEVLDRPGQAACLGAMPGGRGDQAVEAALDLGGVLAGLVAQTWAARCTQS